MKTRLRAVAALVVLVGVSLVAADPAYVGKWKLNTAKSQLTGDTVTISKAADGMMTLDRRQGVFDPGRRDGVLDSGVPGCV